MSKKVKIFISQPMHNKPTHEILEEREKAIRRVKKEFGKDAEIIESFFDDYNPVNGCIPLKYLAKSLELLADADVVYFCKGWSNYRGCRLEYLCASNYNIKIMKYDD